MSLLWDCRPRPRSFSTGVAVLQSRVVLLLVKELVLKRERSTRYGAPSMGREARGR
jgi:hypothetical protein